MHIEFTIIIQHLKIISTSILFYYLQKLSLKIEDQKANNMKGLVYELSKISLEENLAIRKQLYVTQESRQIDLSDQVIESESFNLNIRNFPKVKLLIQLNKKLDKQYQITQSRKTLVKSKKQIDTNQFQEIFELNKSKKQNDLSNKQYIQKKQNGHIIKGFWLNDKLQGQTLIHYSNGDQFMGNFQNGLRIDGEYLYRNGDTYKGQFIGQFMHGKGTFKIKQKSIKIQGRWNVGVLEGYAKVTYQNGDVYYGNYDNMKKQGWGYYFFQDGKKYTGNFTDGKIDGKGTLYDNNDVIIAEGQWKQGQFQDPYDDCRA